MINWTCSIYMFFKAQIRFSSSHRSLNPSRWKHPGPWDRKTIRLGSKALYQLNVLPVAMEMIAGHIRGGITIDVALHVGKGVLGNTRPNWGPGVRGRSYVWKRCEQTSHRTCHALNVLWYFYPCRSVESSGRVIGGSGFPSSPSSIFLHFSMVRDFASSMVCPHPTPNPTSHDIQYAK